MTFVCYEIMDTEDAHKLKISTDETQSLLLGFEEERQKKYPKKNLQYVSDITEQIVTCVPVSSVAWCECVKVFFGQ